MYGLSKSKVDPYSLRVKANSVLCQQSGKCNTVDVAVKSVTPKITRKFACRTCEGNIGEAVSKVM